MTDELTERLKVYEQALKEIEKFGHSHGHGCGYTCANIAEKALRMHLKESLDISEESAILK